MVFARQSPYPGPAQQRSANRRHEHRRGLCRHLSHGAGLCDATRLPAIGRRLPPITDEVVSAAYNRPTGRRNKPAKFEWPALLRKLDRIDPSYKQ